MRFRVILSALDLPITSHWYSLSDGVDVEMVLGSIVEEPQLDRRTTRRLDLAFCLQTVDKRNLLFLSFWQIAFRRVANAFDRVI